MTTFYPPQPQPQVRTETFPTSIATSPAQSEPVDPLLVTTIVYMLVSVASINELLPLLMPLRLALVSFGIASALYLNSAKGRRSTQRLLRERPVRVMLALFGWSFFTFPIVLAPGGTFHFVLQKFSTIVILFLLIVAVSRGLRDFRRFALWYFLGTAFYAFHAVRNMSELMAGDWRMSKVSGLYDANDFAVLCVTGLPFAIHFARQRGPLVVRLAALGSLGVLTQGIVASGSRGGLIATAAMGLFILFRSSAIKAGWRVAGLLAIVTVFVVTASDKYWAQMGSIVDPSEDYNVTSDFGRKALWMRGIGYAFQFPIAGVGANNFSFAEGMISKEIQILQEQGIGTPWSAPHNTYVQAFSELGIIGFCIFLTLLGAVWRSMNRAERATTDPEIKSLVQSTKAATLGMLVGVFFLSFAYAAMFYSLLALGTVAGRTVAGSAPAPTGPARRNGLR